MLIPVELLAVHCQLLLRRCRVAKAGQKLVELGQAARQVTDQLHYWRVVVVNLGRFRVEVDNPQLVFLVPVPRLVFNCVIADRDYQVALLEELVTHLVAEEADPAKVRLVFQVPGHHSSRLEGFNHRKGVMPQ